MHRIRANYNDPLYYMRNQILWVPVKTVSLVMFVGKIAVLPLMAARVTPFLLSRSAFVESNISLTIAGFSYHDLLLFLTHCFQGLAFYKFEKDCLLLLDHT